MKHTCSLRGQRIVSQTVPAVLFSVLCAFSVATSAHNPSVVIKDYFESVDSTLWAMTVWPQVRSMRVEPVDELFQKAIDRRPWFESLMRCNSKGQVVNEVIGRAITKRTYRYIGNQSWYRTISRTLKSYYGHLKRRGEGDYYLFWAKPIKIRNRSGVRFGGAVTAKIDLETCLKEIAADHAMRFAVMYGRKTLYSNLDKSRSGDLTTEALSIKGLSGLQVRYRKQSPPAVAAAPAKPQTPAAQTSEVSAPREKKIEPAAETPAKKEAAAEKSTAQKKKGGAGKVIAIIFILLLLIAAAVLLGMLIVAQNKKRKKLLEAIDRGEM